MAKQRRAQPASGAQNRDLVVGEELGITNLMPSTSWQDWSGGEIPTGTLAVGRDPLAPNQDELVFMLRRDGQAQAMLALLTLPIRAAFAKSEWVAPEGGGEAETAFANSMFNLPSYAGGMSVSKSMFLRQTLLSLAHGFSAFEIVRKIPDTGDLAGKVVIDKMGYRDPRTVTFLSDDHGNFQGFRQIAQFGGRRIDVTIGKEDAWYFSANEEHNPMYGRSYFEPAFQHYQMKRKLYYIAHLAAQLGAVPGRIGELPLGANPRDVAEFKKALANFAFNSSMVHKAGYGVDAFNSSNQTLASIQTLIDHHNMMMASSILAKFLQQEDRQVLIDNGKGDASADMFIQLLEGVTSELSEAFTTKLMPQFINYNFGSGVYPIHKFAPLTDSNKEAIQELFTTIVGLPTLNCTPEFVRTTEMKLADRLGYDIDYQKVADEEAQAAEEMQKQAAEEAQLAKQALMAQSQGQAGAPNGGPQGAGNQNQAPKPPTAKGGTPAAPKGALTTGGTNQGNGRVPSAIKASAKQQQAVETIALALNELIDIDDVPDEFAPEGEHLPETDE